MSDTFDFERPVKESRGPGANVDATDPRGAVVLFVLSFVDSCSPGLALRWLEVPGRKVKVVEKMSHECEVDHLAKTATPRYGRLRYVLLLFAHTMRARIEY